MIPAQDKSTIMAYDRAITVFSPEGRLYQVEYATKIIEKGTPAMAILYKDGILLMVDFNFDSKLLRIGSIEKLFKIDNHAYFVSAGLAGDARKLSDSAREFAAENKYLYDEPIEIGTLAKKTGAIKQLFTQYGGARPFAVSFIVLGQDSDGYHIFETEPSGAVAEFSALAIGRGKQKATALFEKNFVPNMSFEQAKKILKDAIKQVYDKKPVDYKLIKFYRFKDDELKELSLSEKK